MKQKQLKGPGKIRRAFRAISERYSLFVERRMKNKIERERLCNTLNHGNWKVRWKAARTIEKIGLETVGLNERILCLLILNKFNDVLKLGEATVPYLIGLLNDVSGSVRQDAVWALGKIKDVRAVGPLIEALKDENPVVRQNAVEALGEIGDDKAVPNLIRTVLDKDEDHDVTLKAISAIRRIGESALPYLMEALEDEFNTAQYFPAAEGIREIVKKSQDRKNIKKIIEGFASALQSDWILKLAVRDVQRYNGVFRKIRELLETCEERLGELGETSETETG